MKYLPLITWMLFSVFCNAQVTQPAQPASGPGSNVFTYGGVTEYDYGTNTNADGFWLFEPTGPKPDSANVVLFCHGLGMTNPKYYGGIITRLVRKGNIVIYPRYQKDLNSLSATFNDSCARGVQRALDTLQLPGHVKPRLYNWFVTGHSVGGILTANMTCLWSHYGLPKPLAALSMQPGANITDLLLPDYSVFPSDVKYLIVIGSQDIIVDSTVGKKLFYETTSVPTSHKNLVWQYPDSHGSPAITATHGEPGAEDDAYDNGESNLFILVIGTPATDAVDFYCYWKLWDALYDCALTGQNCNTAFGDTYEQKFMGTWSDGTPVQPLYVIPSSATGVEQTEINGQEAFIYPNPVSSKNFQLYLNSTTGDNTFQMFDINGRKVADQKISTTHAAILSGCNPGLYFYRLLNSVNTEIARGKLAVE